VTAERPTKKRGQRGIVLVVVLWVLMLLGIVAASFQRDTRVETRVTRNLVENAKAEALADAGVQRAILGLLDPDDAKAWLADGTPYQFSLGEGQVRITVLDEAGKIDLNQAPDNVLLALFEAVGLSAGDAARLVDAVVDFRDPDDRRRPAGAEDPDYVAAGMTHGAKDAPFETVEELLQVLGMTRDLYDRLAPNLTVHSRRQIDPMSASPLVLEVMRQVMPQQLDQMLSARRAYASTLRRRPRVVTVSAEAVTAGGGNFIRDALLQRTGNPTQPFRVLEWRQRWRAFSTAPTTALSANR